LLFLFPLFIGIAILRHRLWDIDIIIKRTLVYGTLTLSVIGLYVLVVVGLGTLIQVQGNIVLSLLATGLIAVLFQPLRLRLQRGVNRLLYGERDDPYAVLSRLGNRLEATLVPEKVLPTIVETIAPDPQTPLRRHCAPPRGATVHRNSGHNDWSQSPGRSARGTYRGLLRHTDTRFGAGAADVPG
jgi:hypothetical protein